MLGIWDRDLAGKPHPVTPGPPPTNRLYRLRTSRLYGAFFYALTHWILPTVAAAAIVCGGVIGIVCLVRAIARSLVA
jgi:hypothetical protein